MRETRPETSSVGLIKIVLTLAVLLVGVATVTVSSLALFTDSEAVGSNAFTTGTIDIAASPASAVVTMSTMVPGDQVTAPLRITNAGSLDLR